ncbi:MAG: flagellar basal-body rod protein FlgF [Thermodesulfobacteriota bacterium]|nr:flagellar basal-body rod protein FlgF [Thermodesulfobacteriota bacterium]
MSEGIYIAGSGALIQKRKLEVLANNIANVNTVGFKEDKVSFNVANLTGLKNDKPGNDFASEGTRLIPSKLPFKTFTNFSPGHLEHTGNSLDIALEGDGFFCIETTEGTQYTRKGNFTLNHEGIMVTQEGLPVLGEGGTIQIDASDFVVDAKGNIVVDGSVVATIKVVDFPQSSLEKAGNTRFTTLDPMNKGETAEGVNVKQGYVEHSNVNIIRMMTDMIDTLRGYESYQKIIRSLNDIDSKAINELGSVD